MPASNRSRIKLPGIRDQSLDSCPELPKPVAPADEGREHAGWQPAVKQRRLQPCHTWSRQPELQHKVCWMLLRTTPPATSCAGSTLTPSTASGPSWHRLRRWDPSLQRRCSTSSLVSVGLGLVT
jgi:hypothetical protein